MKKVFFLLILPLLFSCDLIKENGINYKIVNNSNSTINDIVISTSEKVDSSVIKSIAPNKSAKGFLIMKNAHTDGSYTLTFNHADGSKEYALGGYYTNGIALNSWIRFEIQTDTVLIKAGNLP